MRAFRTSRTRNHTRTCACCDAPDARKPMTLNLFMSSLFPCTSVSIQFHVSLHPRMHDQGNTYVIFHRVRAYTRVQASVQPTLETNRLLHALQSASAQIIDPLGVKTARCLKHKGRPMLSRQSGADTHKSRPALARQASHCPMMPPNEHLTSAQADLASAAARPPAAAAAAGGAAAAALQAAAAASSTRTNRRLQLAARTRRRVAALARQPQVLRSGAEPTRMLHAILSPKAARPRPSPAGTRLLRRGQGSPRSSPPGTGPAVLRARAKTPPCRGLPACTASPRHPRAGTASPGSTQWPATPRRTPPARTGQSKPRPSAGCGCGATSSLMNALRTNTRKFMDCLTTSLTHPNNKTTSLSQSTQQDYKQTRNNTIRSL